MSQDSRLENATSVASSKEKFLPYSTGNVVSSEEEWEPPQEPNDVHTNESDGVQEEVLPSERKKAAPNEDERSGGIEVESSAEEDEEADELYNPEDDYDSEDSDDDSYDSNSSSSRRCTRSCDSSQQQ